MQTPAELNLKTRALGSSKFEDEGTRLLKNNSAYLQVDRA